MGDIGDSRAIEPLEMALGDYEYVRKAAAEALYKLGVSNWRDIIKGEPISGPGGYTLDFDMIAKSNDPKAFDILIKALNHREHFNTDVAKALGKLAACRT